MQFIDELEPKDIIHDFLRSEIILKFVLEVLEVDYIVDFSIDCFRERILCVLGRWQALLFEDFKLYIQSLYPIFVLAEWQEVQLIGHISTKLIR
jgi:hypothetical protein